MRKKLLASGVSLLLIYLAWAWGGLQRNWLLPVVWASVILLIGLLVSPTRARAEVSSRGTPWWRDVFFYGGILFLAYLTIQWWNTGRVLFFDVGLKEWRYSAPPYPGWPSAFSKPEAAEMLSWFFPAWVFGLAVRSPLVDARALVGLLRALVYGAGLLSLVGIVEFVTHAKARLWIRPTDEFFASFGYTNHAAAFFVLMGALAAGLLYREILRTHPGSFRAAGVRGRMTSAFAGKRVAPRSGRIGGSVAPTFKPHRLRTIMLAASLLLCLIGANLSLSRAGVILAWALAAFVAVFGLSRGWRLLHGAGRINLAAATIAVLCVFYFAVAGFGRKEILHEFQVRNQIHNRLFHASDKINLTLADRPLLDRAAWNMWQDHPAFGIGGWGFRYLLAFYLPKEEWKAHVTGYGNANVHCDVLQFLAEFGALGCGLMLASVLTLVVKLFRTANQTDPLWLMSVLGLSLVVVFSLIDLPFRCPAILCSWVAVLAAVPRVTSETKRTRGIHILQSAS